MLAFGTLRRKTLEVSIVESKDVLNAMDFTFLYLFVSGFNSK